MPFNPQSRKPNQKKPQDVKKTSCGHTKPIRECPECNNVVDLPTEKKKIALLKEKVNQKLAADPKGVLKAAFILSQWINKK